MAGFRDGFVFACALLLIAAPAVAGRDQRSFGYESWREEVMDKGLDPDEVVFPFHATEEMRTWTIEKVNQINVTSSLKKLHLLQEELFRNEAFRFEYDENLTLTAEEAFESGRGNCMAFTSLFIALSRSVGIPTKLVSVRKIPDVDLDEGLVVINRHVVAGFQSADRLHNFAFYVTSAAPPMQQRIIDDVHASAMYHTNLGGAAIRNDRLSDAQKHLKIATILSPTWSPGWVNLGVARARMNDTDGALEAYKTALEIDPENSSALTNMAFIYREMGLEDEARTALQAAAQHTSNPFTLIAMADVEMVRGDFDKAQRYLRRAKWWYRDEPEIYEAMARLARYTGNEDKVESYTRKALDLRQELEKK
jgi:Flp pilus assembly protein TadD